MMKLWVEVIEIDGVDASDFLKDPKTLTISPSAGSFKVEDDKPSEGTHQREHPFWPIRLVGPLIAEKSHPLDSRINSRTSCLKFL
jgi:hypothetical protein